MKKKQIIIMLVIIVSVLIAIIGVWMIRFTKSDAYKFKKEYESLNNQTTTSGTKYLNVSVDQNNKIYYATFDDVMDLLDHGTGIIYFGFPECPWCRNLVPNLIEATNETSIEKIYYFNALSIRDTKVLNEDGTIVTEKEGTKEYYQLVDALSTVLGPYAGLNDDSILRLYFPTLVFVKDGTIIGCHEGTLDSQKDPYVALTTSQKEELKQIILDQIHDVLGDICGSKC